MSRSGRLTAACLAGATAFGLSLVAGEGVATAAPTYTHTYVVNTWLDPSPASPAGCTSNPEGTCSFRDALTAYEADTTGTDLITFAPSTSGHTFFVTSALVADNTNGVALTITGNGGQNTVLDGSSAAQVLTFESTGSTIMTGVVVQHGSSADGAGIGVFGTGALTLGNDVINNNTAADNGGGIFVASGDTLSISNSSLSTNIATADYGGGIYNDGTLNVASTRFSSNSAGSGGAIYNDATGTATVQSSVIGGASTAANQAAYGGGIDNVGTMTLNATNVSYNDYLKGLAGGGIYNQGSVTLNGGTVTENAAASGGGIFNHEGTVSLLASAQVESNEALYGGGIDNDYLSQLQISQGSTVARNDAYSYGGGVLNCGSLGVTASSVDSNQTQGEGGGIYNSGYGESSFCDATKLAAGLPAASSTAAVNQPSNPCETETPGVVAPLAAPVANGTLTMTQSDLSRNFACFGGGGLYSDGASSTISGSTVNNNSVSQLNEPSSGGGVYSDADTTLALSGDTLSGDTAGVGGGMYLNSPAAVISGGTFTHDTAVAGGALFVDADGAVTIDGTGAPVSFVTNSVSQVGGAIFNQGTVTLQGAFNLARNSSGGIGGAIYNNGANGGMTINGSSPTLSTIYGNSAYYGGGIYNGSPPLALNSTGVTYNTATNTGGGVYAASPFTSSGSVIINNSPNNVSP